MATVVIDERTIIKGGGFFNLVARTRKLCRITIVFAGELLNLGNVTLGSRI